MLTPRSSNMVTISMPVSPTPRYVPIITAKCRGVLRSAPLDSMTAPRSSRSLTKSGLGGTE